jgi:hypothetical protein
MSAVDLAEPLSARMFVLSDAPGADTAKTLAHSLSECDLPQGVTQRLGELSTSVLQAVHHEIATVADGLLNLDLGDLLLSGWRKYTALTQAAQRTLANPGTEEIVVLATHRVVSTHHPTLDLTVDGIKIHTFAFELKAVFDLNGVAAVLRQGELVALRGGECVLTATLTLEGTPLELSQKRRIDLALVIPLHRPIPLTRQHHHPPKPHPDSPALPTQPN